MSQRELVRLGDVATIVRKTIAPERISDGTTYVGLENIERGGALLNITSVSGGDLASTKFEFTADQVLFGKLRPYLAKIARPAFSGVCSTDILPITPGPRLDKNYLAQYLVTPEMVALAASRATGANLPRLSPGELAKFEMPLPPLEEQRRIAAILDQADALRAKRREALAHLDDLSQSIFLEMFGDPIENAHNFPIKALLDWVVPARPITYGILMPGPDHPGGVPYVRVVDIKNGAVQTASIRRTTVSIAKQYKRSSLQSGDLLMSIRGHVGRLAVTPDSLVGANITQDTTRLAIHAGSSAYVMAALASLGLQRWMARHTKGVAVRGINLGDVKRIPIPDPPMGLQWVLAGRLSTASAVRRKYSEQAKELDHMFASLQSRAFAGEL